MTVKYLQEGDIIPFTNAGTAIAAGDPVIIGSNGDALIGVALVGIANGATGSVALEGVFSATKVSAAVIAQGEYVTWDASAAAFDDNLATPAAGDVSDGAIAWASAGNGATTVQIKLIGKPGVLA